MNADLLARQILCAAYCYYVLDHSIMDDATYDRYSLIVADNWEELDPCRKWAMGDPKSTRSSGYHFKYTRLCVDSACRITGLSDRPGTWKYHKKFGSYRTGV